MDNQSLTVSERTYCINRSLAPTRPNGIVRIREQEGETRHRLLRPQMGRLWEEELCPYAFIARWLLFCFPRRPLPRPMPRSGSDLRRLEIGGATLRASAA